MEELHYEKATAYLTSFKMLGPQKFLAEHPCPVLLENYRAHFSRKSLFQVKTMVGGEIMGELAPEHGDNVEDFRQAWVIRLEKRDRGSAEHMIFVGRSRSNDIVLMCKTVSKLHAYFCQVPGSDLYQLVDMDSTNGTFVNGQRLLPSVKTPLQDGDELAFGSETRMNFFTAAGFGKLLQQFV